MNTLVSLARTRVCDKNDKILKHACLRRRKEKKENYVISNIPPPNHAFYPRVLRNIVALILYIKVYLYEHNYF